MTTRVAFLRAVNLGRRKVRMADVVAVLDKQGMPGAWTLANSGNVVFDATGARGALEKKLEAAIERSVGFEVTTFVRSAAELRRIVSADPFTVRSSDTYFVTFLKSAPTASGRRSLEDLSNKFDTLHVAGRDVHWRMRGKSTDSTIRTKDWEAVVGRHRSTSRNMNLLRKLMAKIDA